MIGAAEMADVAAILLRPPGVVTDFLIDVHHNKAAAAQVQATIAEVSVVAFLSLSLADW